MKIFSLIDSEDIIQSSLFLSTVLYNQGMFTYKTKIHLHDTDAAGRIFFANQFTIIHDAYEQLLEDSGFSFQSMLKGHSYFLPIVHAESSYLMPLAVGDKIEVIIKVGHIGTTSFSFEYNLMRGRNLVGTAKTVHVTVSNKTHKKMSLPKIMRDALAKYQCTQSNV
jgi:1,4-dihydroxy-2-naphthoyl-CoA hydrolase